MEDKVVVTHRGALLRKYGTSGVSKIRIALAALVAADRKRGLHTALIYLDDSSAMKKCGGKAVSDETDCRGVKAAIDKVFAALAPSYVLILGATDVVPHQDLANPAYSADGDDDKWAFGDLPYACEGGYSRDPAQFVGPTRVVGRLPDLVGATEPSYLLGLLTTATTWKSRPPSNYNSYFGLSADSWKSSTALSLSNVFGNSTKLILSPPKGPRHTTGALGSLVHFINCHGGPAAPEFYGQKGKKYPVALTSSSVAKSVAKGTVVAVECCFGAELYDSITLGLDKPICQTYLGQGAVGFFGSTTVAYGPATGNGVADLICQFFLINLLSGSSIGMAALMARQQYVSSVSQMDPIDLKTLAQFCLYGDPSVHPVAPATDAKMEVAPPEATARFRREERRKNIGDFGASLQEKKPTASKRETGKKAAGAAKTALGNIALLGGLPKAQEFTAFKVKGSRETKGSARKVAKTPSRYYVTVGWPEHSNQSSQVHRVAIVAKELGGRIIDYRIYEER